MRIIYKPSISLNVLIRYRGIPNKFSRLKIFMALVDPDRVYRKEVVLQVILTPSGLPVIGCCYLE